MAILDVFHESVEGVGGDTHFSAFSDPVDEFEGFEDALAGQI